MGFYNLQDLPIFSTFDNVKKCLTFRGCSSRTLNQRLLHLYLDNDVPKISKFRLSQTSDFQTLITQNWSKVLMSFFHILKLWYSELHVALVSCQNLNLSLNDSPLKKVEVHWSAKMVSFKHLWEFQKMSHFERL